MNQASGWNIYYVVLMAGLFALLLPLLSNTVNLLLRLSRKRFDKSISQNSSHSKSDLRDQESHLYKTKSRYFLGITVATVLLTLSLMLIPYAKIFREQLVQGDETSINFLIYGILSIAGFLILGIFYANRKGDLSWLKSYLRLKDGKS